MEVFGRVARYPLSIWVLSFFFSSEEDLPLGSMRGNLFSELPFGAVSSSLVISFIDGAEFFPESSSFSPFLGAQEAFWLKYSEELSLGCSS